MAVLSLIALSGLLMYVFNKPEPLSDDPHKQEVDCVEDKKETSADFVDFSGGTWGI